MQAMYGPPHGLYQGINSHFRHSCIQGHVITISRTWLKFIGSLSAKSHIKKKRGLTFNCVTVAAACNYTMAPSSVHVNLLSKPFGFEGCSLGFFIKSKQKTELVSNFFLFLFP